MSYCEIIIFKDGKPEDSIEFRNAWGGAARIWTALYDRHLKDPANQYDTWLSGSHKKLWGLVSDDNIPETFRAVLASTFDRAIVRREHFERFAADLRAFDVEYPCPAGCINHLPSWADSIDRLSPDVEAIGFYGTSCGENLFYEWDDEKEENIPYDLSERDDYFEPYKEDS